MNNAAVVLLCYARSGGTVFSSALSSLPNVCLVSEINPVLNAKGNIKEQVKDWYEMDVHSENFADSAKEVYEQCQVNEQHFVIRDFSFIDFTPHKLNAFAPSKSFSTLNVLKDSLFVQPIALVRNAFDVWISRGCPPNFSEHYLDYVQALLALGIPIYRYEDFCENTEQTIQQVCEKTGIVFSPDFMQKSLSNQNITGDNDLKNPSRGKRLSTIGPLKRQRLPQFLIKKAQSDKNVAEANRLLGYPTDFYDAAFENEPSFLSLELKWFLKRLIKKYPTDLC